MTRGQRAIHRVAWPVLAVLLLLGAGLAIALRPPPDPPAQVQPT